MDKKYGWLTNNQWKTKEELNQYIVQLVRILEDEEANELHAIKEYNDQKEWEDYR